MKLVLGVVDVAYRGEDADGSKTTGDVAEILEARYHVMETFVEERRDQIAALLANSVATAIQDAANGHVHNPTFEGEQNIEAMFRAFLASGEMEKLIGPNAALGRGYAAAARGMSSRRKKPSAKRDARPAFIDTGQYMASFRASLEK